MNAGVTGHPERGDRRGRPRRLALVITLTLTGVIAATLLVALGAKAGVARLYGSSGRGQPGRGR